MVTTHATAAMTRRRLFKSISAVVPIFVSYPRNGYGQEKFGFPDGYDAVQAAPNSHKIIFENALVRVLEVTVPPPGTTEPMHHHRWPSFFLSWDGGGNTPHVRYLRPDGSVTDEPSKTAPIHPSRWSVQWMKPEPMHAIQVVDRPGKASDSPPLLRIEIKCGT